LFRKRSNIIKILAIVGMLGISFIPVIVYAITDPTSPPSVSDVFVNRSLISDNDTCIYGRYLIPYTAIPDVNADETYTIRLIDTDNTTQKGAVKPFSYFNKGYNYGVFGLYFTSNITWDTQYIIRISQNPAHFTSPVSYDYVMPSTAYSTETTQDANQVEMAGNILILANYLEQQYTAYTLIEGGPAGSILAAPQGETYFRGAIPGIQFMAPSLYLLSVTELDYTSTNWTSTQANTYEQRNQATWVGASENATATQFGLTRQTVLGIVLIIPLCLGAVLISTVKYKKSLVGLLCVSIFVIMGYDMGWLAAAIFATVHQMMAIYTAYVWFYSRG
jgi:hypothetical protein